MSSTKTWGLCLQECAATGVASDGRFPFTQGVLPWTTLHPHNAFVMCAAPQGQCTQARKQAGRLDVIATCSQFSVQTATLTSKSLLSSAACNNKQLRGRSCLMCRMSLWRLSTHATYCLFSCTSVGMVDCDSVDRHPQLRCSCVTWQRPCASPLPVMSCSQRRKRG